MTCKDEIDILLCATLNKDNSTSKFNIFVTFNLHGTLVSLQFLLELHFHIMNKFLCIKPYLKLILNTFVKGCYLMCMDEDI